jgi:hypothetical protein
MDELREFKKLLQKKMKGQVPVQTFWATVHSVDWDSKTMDVVVGDLIYPDALLGLGSHYIKPKLKSKCLLGSIENKEGCFLIYCSEIEEYVITVGETKITADPDGYSIKKGTESLVDVLSDLIAEVSKIVVVQGTTINVPAMTQIGERLKEVLK